MIVMGIDPGVSTGIAIFDTHTKELKLLTLTAWKNILQTLLDEVPDQIVLENLPSMVSEGEAFFRYAEKIHAMSYPVLTVSPNTWKPISKARSWKTVEAKNQHERDACDLIRYFFFIHKSDFLGV